MVAISSHRVLQGGINMVYNSKLCAKLIYNMKLYISDKDQTKEGMNRLTASPGRAPNHQYHSHHHILPIVRKPTAAKVRPVYENDCDLSVCLSKLPMWKPRTQEGLQRISDANIRHGRQTKDKLAAQRHAAKVGRRVRGELKRIEWQIVEAGLMPDDLGFKGRPTNCMDKQSCAQL